MNAGGCPACGCVIDAPAHSIVAALVRDDLDAALESGLLVSSGCPSCSDVCTAVVLGARDERRIALAARERFRAREARLARRSAEKAAARRSPPAAAPSGRPALPTGAANALARAMARAKGAER